MVRLEVESGEAVLGDVPEATLVILNNDTFPHGLPEEDRGNKIKMLWYFLKHVASLMRSETRWGLLLMCWPGLSFIVNQVILLLLINVALADGGEATPTRKLQYLYGLCFAYAANFAVTTVVMSTFSRLKLGGKCTIALRTALMSTALQFTKEFQDRYGPGKVTRVAEVDVQAAADMVWTGSFALVSACFQLVCGLGYAWFLNIQSVATQGVPFTVAICAIPLIIALLNALVLAASASKMGAMAYSAGLAGDEVTEYGSEMLEMRETVTTYGQGWSCTQAYQDLHAAYNGKAFAGAKHRGATQFAARWASTLLSAILFGVVGYLVVASEYPLANFVTLYNTMSKFSTTFASLFAATFRALEGYGHVLKICEILNADTRCKELKRRAARRARLIAEHDARPGARLIGPTELRLQDVGYTHTECVKPVCAFPPLSMGIEGGQIMAVVAPPAVGKRTTLALLARQIHPDSGFIHVPPGWHVRFVSAIPALWNDTLMANLRFGSTGKHSDEEVWAACRAFGISEPLIGAADLCVGDNGNRLSYTDATLVCIVRAMLSKPDLLLLPSTLDGLGPTVASRVMGVLHAWVRDHKLARLSSEYVPPPHLAKPKLVIISTKMEFIKSQADVVVAWDKPETPVDGSDPPDSNDKKD